MARKTTRKEPSKRKPKEQKLDKKHKESYAKTWGTPFGKSCINLNQSLAEWLGPRLIFLAEQESGVPFSYVESEETIKRDQRAFHDDLSRHGKALVRYGEEQEGEEEAQQAMNWVAENFIHLWH